MPRIYRLLHATSKEEQVAVQAVLEEFFKMERLTLRHKRCDAELRWQSGVRENSQKANRIRWENERQLNQDLASDRTPPGLPMESIRYPYQNQNQNQRKTKDKKDKTSTTTFGRREWEAKVPPKVEPENWLAWAEVRAKLGCVFSERAWNLAANKLVELEAKGYSPNELVKMAAIGTWKGIWEPMYQAKTKANSLSQSALDFATGKGCR
jgi:uncharacterized protein YdaU (DUF1376 family)